MASVTSALSRWFYHRLTNDPDGVDDLGKPYQGLTSLIGANVFENLIPENVNYPALMFNHHSGSYRNAYAHKLFYDCVYFFQAIGKGEFFGDIEPIQCRLFSLFDEDLSIASPDYPYGKGYAPDLDLFVMGVTLTSEDQKAQIDENVRYNYLGGYFHVQAYLLSDELRVNSTIP